MVLASHYHCGKVRLRPCLKHYESSKLLRETCFIMLRGTITDMLSQKLLGCFGLPSGFLVKACCSSELGHWKRARTSFRTPTFLSAASIHGFRFQMVYAHLRLFLAETMDHCGLGRRRRGLMQHVKMARVRPRLPITERKVYFEFGYMDLHHMLHSFPYKRKEKFQIVALVGLKEINVRSLSAPSTHFYQTSHLRR